jgi:teichuronic acid biosynthesis glycosyltransferase TuaC
MLRIAVITQYFPTKEQPWRGHSAYQTLRALAKDALIEVFFPHAWYPPALQPKSRIYRSLDTSYCPPDMRAHYINYPALPALSRPVNGWIAGLRLLPHVRRFRPDIILSYVLYPDGYAAVQIGKSLGVPVVTTAIGSDLNRIPGAIERMLTRKVIRDADAVVTVSRHLLATAIEMGADPRTSRAVLNGCDLTLFRPGNRASARDALRLVADAEIVIYVGRLDLKKGLIELVDAVTQLHQNRPSLHLYLVGDGPDKAAVHGRIQRQNAEGFVTVLPSEPSARVALWMAASDVVTLPSYQEGCPNVILEARAVGRPVVATHVGGIPEILSGEGSELIPPRDTSSLAAALQRVLTSAWDTGAISRQCSRSWQAVAVEMQELCTEVLNKTTDWALAEKHAAVR